MLKNGNEERTAFTKRAFLRAEEYADRRDLIAALLKDEETYTVSEVDEIITSFLGKEVK